MKFLLLGVFAASAFGQCTTGGNGWAVTGLSAIQNNLLGPLTCYGNNPWPYGDIANRGTVDYFAPIALAEAPVLGAVLPGTFSFTSGSDTLTTTVDQSGLAGYITCAWTSVDGPGTGRMIVPIASVTSTTVVGQEHFQEPSFSGVNCYRMSQVPDSYGCDFTCWTVENPSQSWPYYDVPKGIFSLHYREGSSDTTHLSYARQFADIQWQWVIDHGYRTVAPRAASMISQFFRAGEGHPERLPGLYNLVSLYVPLWATNGDLRESGYTFWDVALGAKVDTDATRHAQYCSWLSTYTASPWIANQNADGSYSENEFALNASYVSAPKSFTPPFQYQSAPWRQFVNIKSLEAAYESFNDVTAQGCNNPSLAANVLVVITKAVTWQNNYGRDAANRGDYYEVNSQSNDQATIAGPGTVAIANGSTALVGTGTNFLTHCTSEPFAGLITPRTVYKFASCSDNTHAVLTVAYGLYGEIGNLSGSSIAYAPIASTSCHSLATQCFTGTGDRNLTRTNCGGIAWLYNQTLNATYKSWADECYSATLGGPTAGMNNLVNLGTFVLPCSGPACDGYINDVIMSARNCSIPGPPTACANGISFGNLGKNWGEAFGAPGIDNALAWTLVPSASPCDLNGDGKVNVQDTQIVINMSLSLIPCTANINGAGVCNSVTISRVVTASLGGACVVGP